MVRKDALALPDLGQLPTSVSDSSQLPVTVAPEDPTPAPGLCGRLHSHGLPPATAHTHTQSVTEKQ